MPVYYEKFLLREVEYERFVGPIRFVLCLCVLVLVNVAAFRLYYSAALATKIDFTFLNFLVPSAQQYFDALIACGEDVRPTIYPDLIVLGLPLITVIDLGTIVLYDKAIGLFRRVLKPRTSIMWRTSSVLSAGSYCLVWLVLFAAPSEAGCGAYAGFNGYAATNLALLFAVMSMCLSHVRRNAKRILSTPLDR